MKRRRRALGQHFLQDNRTAQRLIDLFSPTEQDTVLEVGAGRGALTHLLAGRVAKLFTVEVDENLASQVGNRFASTAGVEVIHGDILRLDWRRFVPDTGALRIIGNLPYSISKPLLRRLAEQHALYCDALVTVQDEVAQRVVAKPGSRAYGAMTLLLGIKLDADLLFAIPARAFSPPPAVLSRVIRLRPRLSPPVLITDEAFFARTVMSAFQHRRKVLANSLKAGLGSSLTREEIEQALQSAGIDPGARSEVLSLEDFSRLTAVLARVLGEA